jgi:hypothetical protein
MGVEAEMKEVLGLIYEHSIIIVYSIQQTNNLMTLFSNLYITILFDTKK